MKIGIIGAGNIGGTLGQKWAKAGHSILFGVRNPRAAKFEHLRESGEVVPVVDAAGIGETVVLALPASGVADFIQQHAQRLANKLIIDTTNDMSKTEMSNLELLAEMVPTARLVRAFNALGWENFASPEIGNIQIDLIFCAQPAAREESERLISDIGLHPLYIGDLDMAPALDGMTRIWVALAFRQGYGRRIAFKVLKEE
jgi:hypothetical protein